MQKAECPRGRSFCEESLHLVFQEKIYWSGHPRDRSDFAGYPVHCFLFHRVDQNGAGSNGSRLDHKGIHILSDGQGQNSAVGS